jgi:phosphoesterase RecJ-like protein
MIGTAEGVLHHLRAADDLLIVTHLNPDGDAIGSQLALFHLLSSLGKRVSMVNHDPVPRNLRFLPSSQRIGLPADLVSSYGGTVLVDCADPARTGAVLQRWPRGFGEAVVIDHHATSRPWAAASLIDPAASSTCELIHRLLGALGRQASLPEATCIYAGMVTDTGSFRYANTTPAVLQAAAELVGLGVDPAFTSMHLYDSLPRHALLLLGRALATLQLSQDGLVSWMSLTAEDVAACGSGWEETEEFVGYPRAIPSAVVALLFKLKREDEVKVSLRSRGEIDVAAVALRHGGGGHRNAAGCTLRGSLDQVVDEVVDEVHRELLRYPDAIRRFSRHDT